MLYIGVDLGTSACKFLLVDETGKVCNQVSREYPLKLLHRSSGNRTAAVKNRFLPLWPDFLLTHIEIPDIR